MLNELKSDVREMLHEQVTYRELLLQMTKRDLMLRYKQTIMGFGWAIFMPLLNTLIFTLIFTRAARLETDLPYPIFAYTGLMAWNLTASTLRFSVSSLTSSTNLVTKVYFPRLLLPGATVFVPLVDLALGCVVLVPLMTYYDVLPNGMIALASIGFVLLTALTALGAALWLSAVNVRYRDVPQAIPVFMQVLPLLSGVPFAINGVPEKWQWILSLNPMTSVISGWRWALIDAPEPEWGQVGLGVTVAVLLFLAGLTYFRSSEPRFADTI
jgi:ABC-type polysaccharide/polyol phosphate export permease